MTVRAGPAGCAKAGCYAPGTACVIGEDLEDCVHFDRVPAAETGAVPDAPWVAGSLPWSALALGEADLEAVAAVGRQRLVGVLGAAGAGKTTALAGTFGALRQGDLLGGRRFAGSYTLRGWHELALHLDWLPWGSGGFPPHTTSVGRSPSLLHLALAVPGAAGTVRDLLLTDAPGEWFREWAYSADSPAAAGARWIAEKADLLVIVADAAALSGPDRGAVALEYESLANRLASAAPDTPVVPLLSKADVTMPESVWRRIQATNTDLFGAATRPMSISHGGRSLIAAMSAVVELGLAARSADPHDTAGAIDSLLAYRSPQWTVR